MFAEKDKYAYLFNTVFIKLHAKSTFSLIEYINLHHFSIFGFEFQILCPEADLNPTHLISIFDTFGWHNLFPGDIMPYQINTCRWLHTVPHPRLQKSLPNTICSHVIIDYKIVSNYCYKNVQVQPVVLITESLICYKEVDQLL